MVMDTTRNHPSSISITSFGECVLGNVHLEVANMDTSISWIKSHLPPKQCVEGQRLSKYFRSEKSFWRKLCSGQSFLCTLLKCGRALKNEELWWWRERFQRLPSEQQCVQRGRWQRKGTVAGRLLSLNCCSAGRFVSALVCIHQLAVPMAQQHLSVDTFPVVLHRVASGNTSVLDLLAFVLSWETHYNKKVVFIPRSSSRKRTA